MGSLSVTVLCPNGRRVTVKISPNTSVLQIIEEASKKEGFNPDEYNLKQLNRVLDSGLSVRYAGLPNRCQLEMVPSATPRAPASVTVHILTTSGGLRLVHDFPSTANLWEILNHHEKQKVSAEVLLPPADSQQEAVLVYTMRRISGPELQTTTLRTLGLTKGKCMMRHSIQLVNSKGPAHVSGVLAKRHKKQESEELEETNLEGSGVTPSRTDSKQSAGGPLTLDTLRQHHHQQQQSQHESEDVTMESMDTDTPSLYVNSDVTHSKTDKAGSEKCGGYNAALDLSCGSRGAPSTSSTPPYSSPSTSGFKVIKLGEHNAIIFSMNEVPPTLASEEDDTFFQLSKNEVKRLYMEQKDLLRELDEALLMTVNMREMEENKRVLCALNQYPVTHLRVYFPDQHVIQVAFKPIDTVAKVVAAIRPFLADNTQQFQLSMRHPPKTLTEDVTLVSAGCVPNARLYYESSQASPPYLSPDALANKSSFTGACTNLAQRKHGRIKSGDSATGGESIGEMEEEAGSSSSGSASTPSVPRPGPSQARSSAASSQAATGAVPKVPKWFKLGK